GYMPTILGRERIRTIGLRSGEADPILPKTFVPRERFVWTYPIVPLVHPEWAQKKGATSIHDVVDQLDKTMEAAVSGKCVAFKNAAAYYRPFALDKVDKLDADTALKLLLRASPAGHIAQAPPYYSEPPLNPAFKPYHAFP